ncbi:hypothetical protein [Ferrovum myxofaciens]|uniref:Uncharacterized protein n=1 Tax=Ferrovum myxofaciens TaxID=416213 RepID=A0A9E6MY40_9PROT|nr:hypothetical protein [Ferrovum myxofaciens]QKE39188.1 MAG: hypothetical protein HO273_11085 [Ferrovum myxofaciens]QWY74438.1 MAG: hypothetical protein JVY19_11635 [Ferrovum myxofaciens]QWY77187.1 MAG: hypothetical protein JZL65_12070 [Ferrovum myxofaciens]
MDAFGIRAIHPRPERRGFSRSPGNGEGRLVESHGSDPEKGFVSGVGG